MRGPWSSKASRSLSLPDHDLDKAYDISDQWVWYGYGFIGVAVGQKHPLIDIPFNVFARLDDSSIKKREVVGYFIIDKYF